MKDLEIIEVIRRLDSGITEPYQCRLSDGNVYAVKGRQALYRGLIAESIAADLGRQLKLPIPEYRYCNLVVNDSNEPLENDVLNSLGTGKCFASQWIEPSEIFNLSMVKKDKDISLARIYVFDHWINNGDRTLTRKGGNVNLLLSLVDEQLVVFDHNLAFSDTHRPDDLRLHVGRCSWNRVKDLPQFKNSLKQEMIDAHEHIHNYMQSIPDEWMQQEPNIENKINNILYKANEENFWNELG